EIATPLIGLRKHDVVLLGASLAVDFSKTYSCLLGGERHCGVCAQCLARKRAFSLAGLPEPEGFYEA
ncbi:MAG: 7-cyano-7-deazaguanine synthase, partial [Candidatus Methylomirabilales bacterium]